MDGLDQPQSGTSRFEDAAAAGVRVLASSDTGQHAHGTLRPADLATYASDPRTTWKRSATPN
jgi:hypothetical protein